MDALKKKSLEVQFVWGLCREFDYLHMADHLIPDLEEWMRSKRSHSELLYELEEFLDLATEAADARLIAVIARNVQMQRRIVANHDPLIERVKNIN